MKNIRAIKLFSILLLTGFCLLFSINTQAQETKNLVINNLQLTISKLIINNNDITDSLSHVTIANNLWTEFDRHGKEIGKANIIKNKDNEIHIKWVTAVNGAKKDAVTIYKVMKLGDEFTFDIYYNNKKQGYFVASTK